MMKSFYKPTIFLNRLVIVKDQQVVYDQNFHKGMNVIYGKNAFGKSCIMDMIFYVLGGYLSETEWKKEIKECTAVYGEVLLNDEIFTLKRNLKNFLSVYSLYNYTFSSTFPHKIRLDLNLPRKYS